jgi:hypothetical protein
MIQEQMSQALSIAGTPIHPQTLNNASANTGAVDMSKFERVLFVVDIGSVTGGGSLAAKLQVATDSAFTTPVDLSGGGATAVTASSKVVTLECRAGQLGTGYRYVRCRLTEGGSQNVVCACIPLGGDAHQKPASAQDDASVTQRLVV